MKRLFDPQGSKDPCLKSPLVQIFGYAAGYQTLGDHLLDSNNSTILKPNKKIVDESGVHVRSIHEKNQGQKISCYLFATVTAGAGPGR